MHLGPLWLYLRFTFTKPHVTCPSHGCPGGFFLMILEKLSGWAQTCDSPSSVSQLRIWDHRCAPLLTCVYNLEDLGFFFFSKCSSSSCNHSRRPLFSRVSCLPGNSLLSLVKGPKGHLNFGLVLWTVKMVAPTHSHLDVAPRAHAQPPRRMRSHPGRMHSHPRPGSCLQAHHGRPSGITPPGSPWSPLRQAPGPGLVISVAPNPAGHTCGPLAVGEPASLMHCPY